MEKIKKQVGKQPVFQPALFFTNEIFINNRIDDCLVDNIIEALDFLLENNHKKIFVFLNSPGGDVLPSRRLYEKLISFSEDIEITGFAGRKISSAAVTIFQGFDIRLISPKTRMIIHNLKQETTLVFTPFVTSKRASRRILNRELKQAELQQKFIQEVLAGSSRKKRKKIIRLLKSNCELSAEEIINLGFADGFYPDDLP